MHKQDTNESILATQRRKRRRFVLIGFIGSGGIVAILALAGFLFIEHRGGTKPISRAAAVNPGSKAQAIAPPDAPNAASTDPQIDLTADDLKKAQIHTARVMKRATETTLRVPGIVKPDEYREVQVTPIADGIVRQVPVVLGDHVRSGQPLAVIFSSELAEAETQYLAFLAELDAEHKKLQRTQNLLRLGAASQQEEEEAAATHAAHEAHVRAALERLRLLGASERQISALKEAEQINSNVTVPAPIEGLVLARMANVGLVVNRTQVLFAVADLSRVWIMASLNEKDFSSVHIGSVAQITMLSYAGRVWNGRVAYIDPQVDPNTRTAQARIEVRNPGETLRFQMYVDVKLTSPGAIGTAVPEAAVQSIGDRQFVFQPIKNNEGSFSMHAVRLGPAVNGYYAALEGLMANDEVVTEGSFILKAEGVRQHPELQ
jgi:cobalt-zinc-cadmium efflux system membrane fusion protein